MSGIRQQEIEQEGRERVKGKEGCGGRGGVEGSIEERESK